MRKKWNLVFTVLMVGLLMAGVTLAANVSNDQPDSSAYVGYDWNCVLPAFKDANGVSIPFKPVGIRPPIGYQGDFYVDEFTDAKIKQAWAELKKKDPEVAKKILGSISVNTDETAKNSFRKTGANDESATDNNPVNALNGNDDLKLTDIRRPSFFGRAPYFEEIARGEQNTYTVEFTVPRDTFERLQLKMTVPVKLRGWFIQGNGVPDAKGKKKHALVIFTLGYTGQWFTVAHPDAPPYWFNVQTRQYENLTSPASFFIGEKTLRRYLYGFYQAGFDVLAVDKRGHGVSGGVNASNNAEISEDIFRILDQLESGEGLTVLAPNGQLLRGKQTAGLLLRGMPAKQVPVIIGGQSQGTMISCFAMQKNLVGWTAYNESDQKFTPAKKYNFKAAILLSDFSAGIGYVSPPDLMGAAGVYQEAVLRIEKNTMFIPTSEILANINKWPAVFIGDGLWDKYQSPEGVYDAYHRAKGLKKLIYVRAMHTTAFWGTEITDYMINKMTEFATRALMNPGKKYPEFKSFKDAVLSSCPYWEPSSRP